MIFDRDKIAWAICPSIREYSCVGRHIDTACRLCPDEVHTSEGPGIQMCRHSANEAADRVIAVLTAGERPTDPHSPDSQRGGE